MSKINNKKKSVGIALTGFLVLGGISQSHVYAFENKNDSSIELHKQAYLNPNYLKKQLNKNKYISLEDNSRKLLTANTENILNKGNPNSEKLTTTKLEKNIDQTNIKTKKNQKHNTGDIEKESVKSSTTEPEEKPSKPVQKEVSTDKDGIYEAEIKTLKEKSDETSMSGTYFEKKAKYTKQNGKVYCEINVLAIDWMKNIKVFLNSKEVNPTITKTGKTKVMGMDHEGATLKFEVDKVNPELIFKMYVEPMSSNVAFRVVGEKLKFQALKDTKPTNKEDKEKDKTKPSTTKPEEKPAKPVQKEVSTDKDGIYEAEIKTLKEKSDETSMSGTYFEKKAKYTKQNGRVYCEINVLAIDWMKNIKVFLNSKEVNPTITKTGKTKVMGMDHEGATLKFEVDKVNPELTFKMYVEPMHCDVTFRVVGEKLKFEALKDTKPANKEDKEKDKTKPSTTKPKEKPKEDNNKNKDEQKDSQEKPKESDKEDTNNKDNSQIKINKKILKVVEFKNLKKGSYNNVKASVNCDNKKHEKLLKENLDIKTDIKVTEEKDVMVTILLKGKYANLTKILVDGKPITTLEISKNRRGLLAPTGTVINNIAKDNSNESKEVQFKLPNINSKIELVTEDSKIPNEKIKANIDIKNDLVSKSLDKKTLPKELIDNLEKPKEKPLDQDQQAKPDNKQQEKPKEDNNQNKDEQKNDNKDKPKESENKPSEKPTVKPEQKPEVTKSISIMALKENSNEPSMAGGYLEESVKYTEKDGKKFFTLTITRTDWMKNIDISVDGVNVSYDKKESGQRAELTFEVNSENSEVTMRMNVVPMGNSRVAFRVLNENNVSVEKPDVKPTEPKNNENKDNQDKPKESQKEDKEKDKTKPSTTKPEEKPKEDNNKNKDEQKDSQEKPKESDKEDTNNKDNSQIKINKKILKVVEFKNLKKGSYNNVKASVNCDNKKHEKLLKENLDIKTDIKITEEKDVMVTILLKGKYANLTKILVDGKPITTLEISKNRRGLLAPAGTVISNIAKDNSNESKEVQFKLPNINSKIELVTEDSKIPNEKIKANIDIKNDLVSKSLDKKTLPKELIDNLEKPTENPIVKPDQKPEVTKSIDIKVLKSDSNELSMAGGYLEPNIKYTEKDDKKFFTVTVTRADWMKNIAISVDGREVSYKKKGLGQRVELTFEVNSENSMVTMYMNVVPMGNARVAFRIVNVNSSNNQTSQKDNIPHVTEISVTKSIEIKVLQQNSNTSSRAANYLDKTAIYREEDGKKYFMITLNHSDWMKNITIDVDGQKNIDYSIKTYGTVSELTFEVNNENSIATITTNIVPINNSRVSFRVMNVNVNSSQSEVKTDTKPSEIKTVKKEYKDGLYNVSIKTLKENSDEPSMAGGYIEKVNYEVKDGKQFILLKLNRIDWMKNITATVDGKTITPTIIERTKNDKGEQKGIVKFEVSSPESKIKLTMNVEPMGNARVSFRVIPEVNSLKLIDQNDAKDQEQKSNEKPLDQNQQVKSDNKDKEKPKEDNTKNKDEQKDDKEKPKESEKKPSGRQDNKEKHSFYEIKVDTLKEKDNSPSMAGEYIKASNYEIKGDKKYLILTLNRTDWMTNIKAIVDGKEITPTIVESFKNSKGEETSRIKFEIPSLESPIKLSMNVEPMGNSRVTFRVVPNKNSLKPINNLNSITNAPAKKTNLDPNSKKKELEPIEETIINSGKEESNNKKNSLPKTGLPINTGILATLGTILSGLGISLKKFKK